MCNKKIEKIVQSISEKKKISPSDKVLIENFLKYAEKREREYKKK